MLVKTNKRTQCVNSHFNIMLSHLVFLIYMNKIFLIVLGSSKTFPFRLQPSQQKSEEERLTYENQKMQERIEKIENRAKKDCDKSR